MPVLGAHMASGVPFGIWWCVGGARKGLYVETPVGTRVEFVIERHGCAISAIMPVR
jgi:hypothetical protein